MNPTPVDSVASKPHSIQAPRSTKSNHAEQGKESPKELRQACRNFEEIFINVVLKEAKVNQSTFEMDGASQMYGEMMTESLARVMAQGGGMGLADVLYKQLSKDQTDSASTKHDDLKTLHNIHKLKELNRQRMGQIQNNTPSSTEGVPDE
jgi:Rod binding domain-containing protein